MFKAFGCEKYGKCCCRRCSTGPERGGRVFIAQVAPKGVGVLSLGVDREMEQFCHLGDMLDSEGEQSAIFLIKLL